MKVINKDNIENFKKKNKIKEWVSYLVVNFVEALILVIVALISFALAFTPIALLILFVFPKHDWLGLIGLIVYICVAAYMFLAIDDKIREDKRKW